MFRCSPSEQLCGCRQVELHHPIQTSGRVQDAHSETRSSSHSVLARRPRPHVDARLCSRSARAPERVESARTVLDRKGACRLSRRSSSALAASFICCFHFYFSGL
ncbi:hypothetical protein CHARACLAT_032337 [Characodon lateralis]|uniref:Uncharacterized protein n=1 Tax=Characodon lateralis TaxID=208331 RepID=A0ABU7F7U6_9TELE|nr:hypothetical protein [Characodon lateralis]